MAKKDVNRLKIMLAVTKRSNKWLAEMLGKDQATISKWCTNTCQPDLETLIRISGKRLRIYTLHNSKKAVTAD